MRRAVILLTAALWGCGNTTAPAPPPSASASSSAMAAAAAPSASAVVDESSLKPAALARKTTPKDKRLADERACEGGDAAACRRAADRYRGYGHIAGCGVDRPGPKPRRLVTAADADADIKQFDKWIRRLCDLGNEEACLQGQQNLQSVRITPRTSYACARGGVGDCPLYQWVVGMHPEKTKALDAARRQFITTGIHGNLFVDLFRKEKKRGGDVLPKEVADLAARICETTRECDEVMLMLDENGYTPQAVAPVRKAAGEALVRACLEGDCVCGEAARYLDSADARAADLAKIGCEDGEPDACFLLGDLYERGAGVPKDLAKAFALYGLACPTMIADDGRADIVSKAACDRLSAKYEEGKELAQDRDTAFFYSTIACPDEGVAFDHSFCVHRAIFHGQHNYRSRRYYLITIPEVARLFLNGPDSDPFNAKECERPSVAELCKQVAPLLR